MTAKKKLPKIGIVRLPVAPFRPIQAKPCGECPFRRASMPGWLGSNRPEEFTDAIYREEPVPCHTSIDYEDKRWKQKWDDQQIGKLCRGALVMAANMCKLGRNQSTQPKVDPDRATVFGHGSEFIAHHAGAAVRSWEED